MCSQQAYPSFTLNDGIIQEECEGYYHPFQALFSPAVRTDGGDLGEHQAQVMAWYHAPQPGPPGHLNLCEPPSHQLNMETPCMVESRKIEDSGSVKSHPVLQYYPHDWSPDFWPGNPNFSSQTQENVNIPGSKVYLTPPNQSPNMPVETVAANLESSRCSSAPTQEVTKENDLLASQTVTSMETQEETLSEVLEDALEMLSEMELEQFAMELRQKRFEMNFTQADVSYALKTLYGTSHPDSKLLGWRIWDSYFTEMASDLQTFINRQSQGRKGASCDEKGKTFSQATICRFESVQLSYRNMCRIKPFLERWLEDTEKNERLQKKLRRPELGKIKKDSLEIFFINNPKPDPQYLERIANYLHIEKKVVYKWFCNRLQSLVAMGPSFKIYEPQPIVPRVGVFSHQEMPFLGYMSGSPPMYNPAFHDKNMFQQHVPHGLQLGNQIC